MARRKIVPERGWYTAEGAITYTFANGAHANNSEPLVLYEELDDNDDDDLTGGKADFFVRRILLWWESRISLTAQPTDRDSASRPIVVALTVFRDALITGGVDDPETYGIFTPSFDVQMDRILQVDVGRAYQVGNVRVDADGDLVTGTTGASAIELWSGRRYANGFFDLSSPFNLRPDTSLRLHAGSCAEIGSTHGWVNGDVLTLNWQARILCQKRRGA